MGTSTNPVETTPDLGRQMVEQVAKARQLAAHLDAQVKERYEAFLQLNKDLVDAQTAARDLVITKERELRDFAVARFQSTQDRHPAPGVGIRITTNAEVTDEAAAVAWAKVSGVGLTLDEKAIRKVALSAPGALDFVRITETATATLAQDLDQALAASAA